MTVYKRFDNICGALWAIPFAFALISVGGVRVATNHDTMRAVAAMWTGTGLLMDAVQTIRTLGVSTSH